MPIVTILRVRFLSACEAPCILTFFLLLLPLPAQAGQESPKAGSSGARAAIAIDLKSALERARTNNQQLLAANLSTALAREDRVQAKAGFLPTLGYANQYVYTEGNGTPSGVFVANDGVHVYSSQANIHLEPLSMQKLYEYRRTVLVQAITEAKAQVVARGLVGAVVQNYYSLVIAQRRNINAGKSVQEAQEFLDTTQKLEKGGEVAHADAVKAQLMVQQRQRDLQDAQLAVEKARIGMSVLIFPDLELDFTVVDDLNDSESLRPFEELRALAVEKSPDLHAAQLALRHETLGVASARSEYLPFFSFDYWYGINANEFSIRSAERRNLGYSAQASLVFPLWNWGVVRSKVRQAEFRRRQAQLDLSLVQKELMSELNSLYAEARSALGQLDSLRRSLDLSAESLRLTVLRYQAGEASVLEVVDAQATLTQARTTYDEGLSRYRVALLDLRTLTGTL
jgi:outer membrane protein TolC